MWPLPVIFEIDVPEMVAPLSVVITESLVTFQLLEASRVSAALLTLPLSDELFLRINAAELMPSVTTLPTSVWLSPLNVAVPPFLPLVPHWSAEAFNKMPDVAVRFTFLSEMTPVAFVT